ncbi:MAG: hypothetical protein HZC44_09780 [Geobacter sp.]|nr:hypothetical protein [Geobacter sp.]
MYRCLATSLAIAITLAASTVRADEPGQPSCQDQLRQRDDALAALARENAILRERLILPPAISRDELLQRMTMRIKEISADIRVQRQAMTDFEGYVRWMTGNVSGYARYLEAGSVAANFARVLPIPYAGQAGMFTKFVSQATLSLNTASLAVNRYLTTSQQFIVRADALEKSPAAEKELVELARFADNQLLKEMNDVQTKLTTTAELSSSSLSFLESLQHYVGSSDEYWAKAKSMIKKGDAEKKEKGYLAESIASLRSKAGNFNNRLKSFDDTVRKDAPRIKALSAYDDLLKDLEARTVQTAPAPASPALPTAQAAASPPVAPRPATP